MIYEVEGVKHGSRPMKI